jgi:hypothetical protein
MKLSFPSGLVDHTPAPGTTHNSKFHFTIRQKCFFGLKNRTLCLKYYESHMDLIQFDAIILQFESLSREDLIKLVRKSANQAEV